jgi:hypothetical protein
MSLDTKFVADVERVLNAPDPSQEPLTMWLRRALEKYRESERLLDGRIEMCRRKNAEIVELRSGASHHRQPNGSICISRIREDDGGCEFCGSRYPDARSVSLPEGK